MMGNALFLEVKILMDHPLFICLLSNKKSVPLKKLKSIENYLSTYKFQKKKETFDRVSFFF